MSDAYENDMAEEQAILAILNEADEPAAEASPTPKAGGRPRKADPVKVIAWRQAHKASISKTAKHWKVSEASVSRWSKDFGPAAERERERYQQEQTDRELAAHEYDYRMMFLRLQQQRLGWTEREWLGRCQRAEGTTQEPAVKAAMEAALEDADREFREDWARMFGPLPD